MRTSFINQSIGASLQFRDNTLNNSIHVTMKTFIKFFIQLFRAIRLSLNKEGNYGE